jgi:hypothetical protein
MKSKIIKILTILFVLIQFIRIDKTNPKIDKTQDFISIYKPNETVRNTLKSSCYDCHSSESKYPWYSNISPVSWMLKHHINEGREELNFSEWGTFTTKRKMKKLEEIVAEVEDGEMPMTPYIMMHSEAKMSEASRKAFLDFFKKLGK